MRPEQMLGRPAIQRSQEVCRFLEAAGPGAYHPGIGASGGDSWRFRIFFVKKKGGKLRMILDCRRSNCHFTTMKDIKLATGESMSRMELRPQGQLYIASADLQNAFYTMAMPGTLQKFFGLRKVQAGELGVSGIASSEVQPTSWVYTRVAVIPMGGLMLCGGARG